MPDMIPGAEAPGHPWVRTAPAVVIVGYGSAGRPFARALANAGAGILAVAERPDSRGWHNAGRDGFRVTTLDSLPRDIELLVISTQDAAIADAAAELAARWADQGSSGEAVPAPAPGSGEPARPRVAMHLSGSLGLEPLAPLAELGFSRLAFHPIQTFPAGAGPERFAGIFAGITADAPARPVALELASALAVQPVDVPERDRARYHLASVLVSNFLPLLLDLGAGCLEEIAGGRERAGEALLPLVRGMVANLERRSPGAAITGPVARNDLDTVRAHLAACPDDRTASLYRELTAALVELAVREGRLDARAAERWRELLAT